MILTVKDLKKEFIQGETPIHALRGVSFELGEKQSLAIVGPSGSGKTTLLSLLAGLEKPSSGTIQLAGQPLSQMSESEVTSFRGKNIGIVFQQFHLMPYLTAEENVCLPLEINGETQVRERARAILEKVGLADRRSHFPSQLSGGECQRVAIARASVLRPKILFADEPSGNLDWKTGQSVIDLLFSMVEEVGTTLILVTHDLELADRCQHKIELLDGVLH